MVRHPRRGIVRGLGGGNLQACKPMKLLSYSCQSGYDRPDYNRILKASYGTFKNRLAIAKQLLLDNHGGCRACDNCFEMGDGDKIAIALVEAAMQSPELKATFARDYSPNCLRDGFPERWLDFYESNNLQLV